MLIENLVLYNIYKIVQKLLINNNFIAFKRFLL